VAKPAISIPCLKSPAIFQKIHYQMHVMLKRTFTISAALIASLSPQVPALARPDEERQSRFEPFLCAPLTVTDGDSLRCGKLRVRLIGIDAPEMPGSCRLGRQCVQGDPYAARYYLVLLTRATIRCTPEGQDRYGRTLARCTANGVDLSCAMIRSGHAVRRYTDIRCH